MISGIEQLTFDPCFVHHENIAYNIHDHFLLDKETFNNIIYLIQMSSTHVAL